MPDRADALRRRLDAARPDAAAQAATQQIEAEIAALGPDLDALLERATTAIAQKASLAAIEDARRELEDAAAPLRGWKDALAAEAKRVAAVLDELAQERRVWSETRGRPETAAAGDVVAQRVESSVQALDEAVKNFAAGLTLLFERRMHVGDAVQIPSQAVFGRVIAIGIRTTVIRNFNGVEVVVPNNDLVSGAVTNWTLSDRLHRIEVPVGVAYGTDPDRVVALLLDVARSNDRMLADPAPQALFKGFGESSLDFVLRAWTDEDYEPRTSELALAVHRTLCKAGIAIPFPQRDLHLASVSPEVQSALSGVDRKA